MMKGKRHDNSQYCCRDCRLCEPTYKQNTLTVKDGRPTLGKCPYETYSVLLSQKACTEHFEPKEE